MMKSTSVLRYAIGRNGQLTIYPFLLRYKREWLLLTRQFSSQSSSSVGITSASGNSNAGSESPLTTLTSFTSTENNDVSGKGNTSPQEDGQRSSTISKAMQAYLKRAKEHQEFMDKQEKEFVFGRRHLANMMGKDPESFTQKDIDESIRYLFPSGLYEPRARPIMKPPAEIYPKQKSAQFDVSGRPHHPFFYTSKPNYYYLLHEMVGKLNSLNKLAPSKSELSIDDSLIAGSTWISKEELENRLLEKINEPMYNEWVSCFERLVAHPKRDKELEFIKSYRKALTVKSRAEELPLITLEPDGRKSVHVPLCMKKSIRADVLVTVPGTGEFRIHGKGLDFFKLVRSRETVISPLQLVGWLGKVDVEANCEARHLKPTKVNHYPVAASGEISKAVAIRWGIATALAALGADVETLRLAGYLERDARQKERKKPGRDGARAKWTWKKR